MLPQSRRHRASPVPADPRNARLVIDPVSVGIPGYAKLGVYNLLEA